ncbi:FimV family protein [Halomonas sp. M20]|uniref:type IV pilus assembly protein FimV n=1 Tax=Halomonas sp. M20 TaxID=2763264 RepID=UPI001D0AD236|nr:FimV/HubP family polar landmark protein [Halomonas sp. M20]
MKHTLPLIVATALALVSTELQALGLAEMQILSRLDEPLRARIPLVDLQGANPDRLQAYLADEADFQGVELPRAAIIGDLRLAVSHEGGNPVLLLSTEQAVSEPYLELVLTLEWPEGKQQHQVNILLDPPGYSDSPVALDDGLGQAPPALVAASGFKRPDGSRRSNSDEPVTTSEEHPRQLQARTGDALSILADRARRGKSATLEQAMLALLTGNPDAFSRNNINALQAGAVLDVPSPEEMNAFDADQARQRVREQNDAWQARHETLAAINGHEVEQAEVVGDTIQESVETPAPVGKETLAASDNETSRGDARALAMAMQQQESRLADLEIDRETIHEALVAMRQEREQLAGDTASLREELTGLHEEVAEALQVLSPPAAQKISRAGNVAVAANEGQGVAGGLDEPSGWQRVTGYMPTIGGMTAVVLLAFLLRRRRQRHGVVRKGRVDPSRYSGGDNEPEPMPAAYSPWSASATLSADQVLTAEAEEGARSAEPETAPVATANADNASTWREKSTEVAFQEDVEHESALPLVPNGLNELESTSEVENNRQWEEGGNGQDEVERIMDYEPAILGPAGYPRPQESSSEESDAASIAEELSAERGNVFFDQKPNTEEEWEVEEVTFETLQLDDKSTASQAFKR